MQVGCGKRVVYDQTPQGEVIWSCGQVDKKGMTQQGGRCRLVLYQWPWKIDPAPLLLR